MQGDFEKVLKIEEEFEIKTITPIFSNMSMDVKRGTVCNFLKIFKTDFDNAYPKYLHSYGYFAKMKQEANVTQKADMNCDG